MASNWSSNLISCIEKALPLVEKRKKPQEVEKWTRRVQKYVKLISKLLKSSNSTGEKHRLTANLARLREFEAKLEDFKIIGGGLRRREKDRIKWRELENVFHGRMKTSVIINLRHTDIRTFLNDARKVFCEKIGEEVKKENALKVNVILSCRYENRKDEQINQEIKYFNTKNELILISTNLNDWFDNNVTTKLLAKVDEFQERDSGWSLSEIINLEVHVNKYEPLRGGSSFAELPQWVQKKHAVVNVQNTDDYFCFLWSIMAARCEVRNKTRPNSYPPFGAVIRNFGMFNYPMALKDIPKFEKLNNMSINVYGIEHDEDSERMWIVPLYLSTQPSMAAPDERDETIHLLMVEKPREPNYESDETEGEEEEIETIYHYTWISSLSRLLSSQISRQQHKTFICDRCLCHFRLKQSYCKHRLDCILINQCRMIFPRYDEKWLKFKNFKFQLPVPYVVYADTECLLEKMSQNVSENSQLYQKHIPHSVAFYVKCSYDDSKSGMKLYRGADCVEWFINELHDLAKKVDDELKRNEPMHLTPEEWRDFNAATNCHICGGAFTEKDVKHRDHCHFTGTYRGAAHAGCNLNYKENCTIPIVFHNLSGYDSHFFIRELAKQFNGEIELLPINKERYIAFMKSVAETKVHLRFIDSLRFMASSIEKLASYIDREKMTITAKNYVNKEELKLVTRKGVFPYEYIDNWQKLEENELPCKELFYSKLNGEHISDTDYEHACIIWQKFNINTLGEYSDLYLRTDVLLLADIFENFRDSCFASYGLDPLHYFTAPGLSFDAMLKMTKVKLELFLDAEMLLFIEKGIRGGLCQCSNRYGRANNRYMGENYNREEQESYLMYLDVNNLYGAAMSHYLPRDGFTWLHDWTMIDFQKIPDDSKVGYILEVDLAYPVGLHEKHKDLPLCPEHIVPPNGQSKLPKLLTTLNKKTNYVVHYRNLKQYLNLGLELTKIHRVLQFNQSPWLKEYIDLNTELRKNAQNEFEKNFYKLMNNSIFGKTMENDRKKQKVKLITKWEGRYGASSYISKPNFHSSTIFDNDMVIISLKQTKIKFNKPIYVGFTILDNSKMFIYDFHYNYIQNTFRNRAKLLYTDTDSLIYQFQVDDIYEEMKKNLDKFDTSDYSVDNPFHMPRVNKKVLGLMKDENNGKIMTEFVGLRAKMYSFKVLGEDREKSRAKGVKKSALKSISFNDYVECLFRHKNIVRTQNMIRSQKHEVFTIQQKKLALSWHDDKRILLPNTSDTLPYGYVRDNN